MISLVLLHISCVMLYTSSAYFIPNTKNRLKVFRNPEHYKVEQYGLPNDENLVYFKRFISSINYDKKIPNWVLQYNCKEELFSRTVSKRPSFRNLFNEHWIPERNSYGEYSRGHLAPAGDYRGGCKDDTFFLEANIVPQDMQNNQGIWNLLEMKVRNNLLKNYDEIWILNGPLFIPYKYGGKKYIKYQIAGNSSIAVPNSLFKVILYKNDDGLFLDSYIIPNKEIKSKNLDIYKVELSEVESKFNNPIFPLINRDNIDYL